MGHLLEQKKPMTEGGKSLPWKFDYLPVIPRTFELEPIKQSEDRLKKVLQLAKSKDVTEIVNACDAGREGELISTTWCVTENGPSLRAACGCSP